MKPLPHALVGLAVFASISWVAHLPSPSWGLFVAAIVSPLPDLDKTERPPYTTPLGHSLLMAVLLTAITIIVSSMLHVWILIGSLLLIEVTLGIIVGLWSHIVTDKLLGEVIYTIPRVHSLQKIMSHTPLGPDFIRLVPDGIAIKAQWSIMNRISDGGLAWPYWGRV